MHRVSGVTRWLRFTIGTTNTRTSSPPRACFKTLSSTWNLLRLTSKGLIVVWSWTMNTRDRGCSWLQEPRPLQHPRAFKRLCPLRRQARPLPQRCTLPQVLTELLRTRHTRHQRPPLPNHRDTTPCTTRRMEIPHSPNSLQLQQLTTLTRRQEGHLKPLSRTLINQREPRKPIQILINQDLRTIQRTHTDLRTVVNSTANPQVMVRLRRNLYHLLDHSHLRHLEHPPRGLTKDGMILQRPQSKLRPEESLRPQPP